MKEFRLGEFKRTREAMAERWPLSKCAALKMTDKQKRGDL